MTDELKNDSQSKPRETDKLATGNLGILESIIMGVSGTAPAFSAATTTTALVAAVGIYSPSSVLYCALIMFGITFSFVYLNRVYPSAGASYTWISLIFGKPLGFFAGWSLLVASALFMVSGTIPVATATLDMIAPHLQRDPFWVSLAAAGWLTLISLVILKGIKPTSYLQVTLTLIEVSILVIIIVGVFLIFLNRPIHVITLSSFSPFTISLDFFAKGAIISLFFFWGWDVTINLTEETRDAQSSPGIAALWSMVIVTLLFIAFIMCVLLALTDAEIQQSGPNVLLRVAEKIFPHPWGNIALISVILSSLGTIETSILQFTRTLFAKSRDGVLHKRWSKIHPVWQTPWAATLLIWALGMVFLAVSSQEASVSSIIDISINVISFQVAFYYGLCGFACAWFYRTLAFKQWGKILLLIVWPIMSSILLIIIDIYGALYIFDAKSIVLGLGGIAIGIFPFWLNREGRKASITKVGG